MTTPLIACYRTTALLSDEWIQSWIAAEQIAISRDFAPHWGDAKLFFLEGGKTAPEGAWPMVFQDDSDVQDALGYHQLYAQGIPSLIVAVKVCLDGKYNVSTTASHEVKETIADPLLTRTVIVGDEEYAVEVCDPPEDDEFAYPVDGHMTSDFVLPAYYSPGSPGPYSFRGTITAPLSLADGGYIGVRSLPDGVWTQRFADGVPGRRAVNKAVSSRTMRRFRGSSR